MTTDPMTTDPMRSLDVVEPPDQWADIVARSHADAAHRSAAAPAPSGATGHRPLAVAAAVVLVVAAVGAALVLRGGGRDRGRASGPEAIWGHRWQLTAIDIAGGSITRDLSSSEGAIVLDTRVRGSFRIQPCNRIRGEADVRGDRFVVAEAMSTMGGCIDPLESLIDLDRTRITIDGDRLALERSEGPAATYRFVRSDAVTPAWAFWGNRWRVTSGTDRSGSSWKEPDRAGPVIDARQTGRLQIDTCRQVGADATIDGDRLDLDGTWETLAMGYCQGRPTDDVVWSVFTYPDTTVAVRGDRFAVRSGGGVIRGVIEGLPASGPESLFGHRWGVALVTERGDPVQIPADGVLSAGASPRTLTYPGCAAEVGGPATIGEDQLVTVDVAPPNPLGDCIDVDHQLELADRFREFFAEPFEVGVVGERAILSRPGQQIVLVQLG